MTERVIWPVDWNRPLSMEEMRVIERLDCAPERLDTFLPKRAGRIPSTRPKRVSVDRRGKDVGRRASRAKAGTKR